MERGEEAHLVSDVWSGRRNFSAHASHYALVVICIEQHVLVVLLRARGAGNTVGL